MFDPEKIFQASVIIENKARSLPKWGSTWKKKGVPLGKAPALLANIKLGYETLAYLAEF